MNKIVDNNYRTEAMACQFNCLNKLFIANDLVEDVVSSHPRNIKNKKEFIDIQTNIKNFNKEFIDKNQNI